MKFDDPHRSEGAWIFLSHSHKDIEKVRLIRNKLEQNGHNPILFFLKCLNDDDAELPDLLRREIEARNWFLLCDSPHARASKYVQEEVSVIKSLEGKVFRTIDLFDNLETQLETIESLSRQATVFVFSEECYEHIAYLIINQLKSSDFKVVTNLSHTNPDELPLDIIRSEIDEALRSGFLIFLVGEEQSPRRLAVEVANYSAYKTKDSYKCNIYPVRVSPNAQAVIMPGQLRYYQWFDLSNGEQQIRIRELIDNLKKNQAR